MSALVGKIKSITDFLSEAYDGFKGVGVVKSIGAALPWAQLGGNILGEALPPIKWLLKIVKDVTAEHKPEELARVVATIAYQRSIEQAITIVGEPANKKQLDADMATSLQALQNTKEIDFRNLSLSTLGQHPFFNDADGYFEVFAEAVGYNDTQVRNLLNEIQSRLPVNFKLVLSHGSLREKFAPLSEFLKLGSGEEAQAHEALLQHAEYQRWLFEEQPVFHREPFSLSHIYIETDCGCLPWGQLRDNQDRLDPFMEQHGGRQPLLETVLGYFQDPSFRDAIVIQGVAGSGKSTFTLHLCAELVRQGLRPIRVRLRDLGFDRAALEALPQAVRLKDEFYPETLSYPKPDDLFLDGNIFKQKVRFGQAEICPYVLVLDGWDEISVSVNEGFQIRVERMLEQIRQHYLTNTDALIRVVLTGRPSTAVTESSFLREKTPILTIRPIQPEQLRLFVEKIKHCLEEKPVQVENFEPWEIPDLEQFSPVFARYQRDYEAFTQKEPKQKGEQLQGSMAVLGLPLLSQMAIRLMAQWQGAERGEQNKIGDLASLVDNPTTLYRHLVDLTCAKAGQPEFNKSAVEPDGRNRIAGQSLRQLLRHTATAMSVVGEESISYDELEMRLEELTNEWSDDDSLYEKVKSETKHSVLVSLVVSYFFKGGQRDLGCEFVHKSFREYLFAEAIVEALKAYGRSAPDSPPVREPYWKDFDENDARYDWSRTLSRMLAPQWLSQEVNLHLRELLRWEIERSRETTPAQTGQEVGCPTEKLALSDWKKVRDGLADLWDWWGEGVHLRPQPKRSRKDITLRDHPPFVFELIEWCYPMDVEPKPPYPAPVRTTTPDGHLGDGLFQLCSLTHYWIAILEGWGRANQTEGSPGSSLWEGRREIQQGCNYQICLRRNDQQFVLFSPRGLEQDFFSVYIARINATGWQMFPAGRWLAGCFLQLANLSRAYLSRAYLSRAYLSRAIYNKHTIWPDGFNVKATGAILVD